MSQGKPAKTVSAYAESLRKEQRREKVEEFAGQALIGLASSHIKSCGALTAAEVAMLCVDLAEAVVAEIERRMA